MIDLHCHLLPGIDDGAKTIQDSLELARLAVNNGITHVITTPHIQPGVYENDRETIAAAFQAFTAALGEENIPLKTGMAAEVRISTEMIPMLAEERIPFLGEHGGYKVMLLEFPHSHIIPGTDKLIEYLLQRKIKPMIVHPERNREIMRHPDRIRPFVEMGCLLQVTAGSIAGNFGVEVCKRAVEMLSNGWVEVLASDAHNIAYRPPELEPGRQAAATVVGEEASWKLVRDNPAAILRHSA